MPPYIILVQNTFVMSFQDFGINSLSDLVHIYDKIVAKIVTPIKDAITAFRGMIDVFTSKYLIVMAMYLCN